jgi:KipI family sensor histidine kinase inhibitor
VRAGGRIARSQAPGDIRRFGDAALIFAARSAEVAAALGVAVRSAAIEGVVDVVGGLDSVLVIYEPGAVAFDHLAERLGSIRARPTGRRDETAIVIPATFDGPDIEEVGRISGLGVDGVTRALLASTLRVSVLGFTPGFAYLSGLPRELRGVPRRQTPRTRVPAGSLALAAGYAAVYPQSTPGGWHLVGRTDVALFDPDTPPHALLGPGDLVRLRAVDPSELSPPDEDPATRGPWRSPGGAAFEVEEPGLYTTVQDLGRPGLAHLGVPRAGAADPVSFALANRLLGNPAGAACLECTVTGPTLLCRQATHAAVVGTGVAVTIDGAAIAPGRVFPVGTGQRLAIGSTGLDLRAYLAVRGGLATASVLGSRSTDRLAGLGPGPIGPGDELGAGRASGVMADHLLPGAFASAVPDGPRRLRAMAMGGDASDRRWDGLFDRPFEVTDASDRVGLRLRPRGDGGVAAGVEVRSAGTTVGTVQVPPDGNPVVLMADHATLGGYPVGAVVITADLGELGRCRPGDTVELAAVTFDEATAAWRALGRALDGAVVGRYPVAAG